MGLTLTLQPDRGEKSKVYCDERASIILASVTRRSRFATLIVQTEPPDRLLHHVSLAAGERIHFPDIKVTVIYAADRGSTGIKLDFQSDTAYFRHGRLPPRPDSPLAPPERTEDDT